MKGNKCEEREEASKGMQHDENKEDAVVEKDISVAFSFFFLSSPTTVEFKPAGALVAVVFFQA